MRILLRVHPATHTKLLPLIGKTKNAREQVAKQFLGLIKSMTNSPNRRVLYLTMTCLKDSSSIFGQNINYIVKLYGSTLTEILMMKELPSTQSIEDEAIACAIRELRMAKNGLIEIDTLNINDIDIFLNLLCTI